MARIAPSVAVPETPERPRAVRVDDGPVGRAGGGVMRDVTLAAWEAVHADRVTCYVISDDGRIGAVHTTAEDPGQRALIEGTLGCTADEMPIWRIFAGHPDPVLVVETPDELPAAARRVTERLGVGAFIGARLEHDSVRQDQGPAFLGALFCSSRAPRRFTEDERARIRDLARLASLTLANARLKAERERLEIDLRQAQRLQAVGQLAAGVAHEINTPIQFVGDSIHFLRDVFADLEVLVGRYRAAIADARDGMSPRMLEEVAAAEAEADLAFLGENVQPALGRALEGVKRVAEIVGAMREFARPQADEQAPADLNRAVLGTITVARNELKYVAEVETDLGEVPPVVCHLGDIQQVVLSLLINAAHAIVDAAARRGSTPAGRIRVTTRERDGAVTISVADNGCGIPEAIRSRIFEPSFTTRGFGRGTGRGLAIAHSLVVERHGGSLSCETELGRGTTFHVRLPVDGLRPGASGSGR